MKAQRLSCVWLVMWVSLIVIGLAAVLFDRAPQNNPRSLQHYA